MRLTLWGNVADPVNTRRAPGGVRGEARRPGPAGADGRRGRGATPLPNSGPGLIPGAGAPARTMPRPDTCAPNAGFAPRRAAESPRRAPCGAQAPGRDRPARGPAAVVALVAVGALCGLAAPAQAQTEPVWSTTMTVADVTSSGRGFASSINYAVGSGGSLDSESFMIGSSDYRVVQLSVDTTRLTFWVQPGPSSPDDYTLEFAGETLPLADATPSTTSGNAFFFSAEWLAANAAPLSLTNFETTLAVDEEVPVCLRTATQVCPSSTEPVWSTTMTVAQTTFSLNSWGYGEASGSNDFGALGESTFTYESMEYKVAYLFAGDETGTLSDRVRFVVNSSSGGVLPSPSGLILEFAGAVLSLDDATLSDGNKTYTWHVDDGTLPATSPLHPDNVRTTIPVDAMVQVCLRTATQVCPGGTTIIPTSSDATLSGLAVHDGATDHTIDLASTPPYTLNVGNAVTTVTLTATPNDTAATVEIQDEDGTALDDAAPGTDGFQVALRWGDNTIQVEVTATDGTTIGLYTVIVSRALARPSVSPTEGITTGLDVSWQAPGSTTIVSYDVQYREGDSGSFTDGPQDVTGTSTSIPGLKMNTSYQVQVRMTSAAGDSEWSPNGKGWTHAPEVTVASGWSLLPGGLATGAKFRLLFVSHDTRWNQSQIDSYNGWVQEYAATGRGHTAIRAHASGFRAVGCGRWVNARVNTGTQWSASDRGVPIHWLGGLTAADDYGDFYDGTWQNEDAPRTEAGALKPASFNGQVLTGCTNAGDTSAGEALGLEFSERGQLHANNAGPLDGGHQPFKGSRPIYGLSQVFVVGASSVVTAPAIVTDGVQVTSTPTTGDTYGLGETIEITVTFDNAVTVDTSGGTPRIQFRLGPPPTNKWAEYSSGSGGTALVFTYTVQAGDKDDDGIWLPADYLELQSGTIRDAADNTVDATLTYLEPGTQSGHKVNATSSDATLSGLALADSGGDTISLGETFVPATTTYTASVANGIETVTLTATKNDSNATVVIASDDDTTSPGVAELDLIVGSNTLTVTVTAEDTTTEREYTITVTRAGATTANVVWSTTMTVGETSQGGRGFDDSFGGGSLGTYTFRIEGNDNYVTALLFRETKGFKFNVGAQLSAYADYILEVAGEELPLDDGSDNTGADNSFIFLDTWLTANATSLNAANYETTLAEGTDVLVCLRTATQVCPGGGTTTSNDATLSGLALADSGGDTISLGETFVPATTTYTASVANGIETVTLTATKNDSNATVVIASDDNTGTPGVAELDLIVGSNTLTVTVTAQDGTTEREYTITVTRATTANVVWSTTMTVGVSTSDGRGYATDLPNWSGYSLDSDSFMIGATEYTVTRLFVVGLQPGEVRFKLDKDVSSYADYILEFAGETLPLTDATRLSDQRWYFPAAWTAANAPSLSAASYKATLPIGARVPACLRTATQVCPGGGTTVTNTAATGTPEISGVPQVGQVLTATAGTIADTDGLPSTFPDDYSVQWLRVDADGTSNEEDIAGEIAETYTLTDDDVGKKVKVKVSFTDDLDSTEMRTSAAYPSSGTVAGTNTAPTVSTVAVTSSPASGDTYGTGEMIQFTVTFDQAVTVVGTPEFEFCLGTTATVSCDVGSSPPARRRAALSSGSGTTALVFSYTVVAGDMDDNGIWIGDQSRTIKLDAAGTIQGTVGGLDAVLTHAELGAKTGHKVNGATANTPATGKPSITGTAQVGQPLTADVSGIMDADGLTNVSYTYQWYGETQGLSAQISGATLSTYTPVTLDVGKTIKVEVSFTDDAGNAEAPLTSDATATVAVPTAPGVTVSTTALTVTEQDTTGGSYTVALDTEPTANVVVTVAGHSGTDVTPNPTTLTFTSTTWSTAQTVTVTAGDDADTTDDTVALTHSAASADSGYGGIAIDEVAVTVSDNDTARVTGLTVTPGNARLVTNWTAVDNATGYKVQWKSGGQNYNTGSRQSTVTSGSTTSHTITGLANGTEYTVRVSATRTGANDGPPSAEETGTPAVPTAPGVTVSTTALTVTEQDSTGNSYTVVLDTEPTANVVVTVAGHSGTDVTPNPTTLTFTASNWETAQTVAVTAGDDADTTDDTVALTHSAASADSGYSGIAIPSVAVTVSDNDTARVTGLTVTPGNAQLVMNWTAVDNATGYKVQWKSGSEGYTTNRQATVTSGSTTSHTITGLANGTEYTVQVSATRTGANDGPTSAEVQGTPAVSTTPGVTVTPTALTVTEQDTTGDSYTVVLDSEPTANVTVTVAGHSGTDVTANPGTLTFTASNWETAQTVTVTAGDDADTTDDTVALTHSAASADTGYSGIAIAGVAVTVSDNDTAGICQRTPAVIAAILNKISSVSDCANVTDTHLAAITGGLPLSNRNVTALAAGDFAGLGALTTLRLHDNALTTLPDGVFAGLDALTTLRLHDNALTTLPDGVFAPLTALTTLKLYNNALPTLPDGVFAGLDALTTLSLSNSGLATLPAGVFAPLTALTWLSLSDNDLTALPAGVFVPLTALTKLRLHNNALTALPAGVFAGLNTLTTLWLNDNALTALPAGVFAGLDMLTTLWLDDNALTALPDDVFEPLTALTELKLANNSGGPFGPDAVALPDDGTVSNAGGTVTLDGSGSNGGPWGTNVTYGWALTNPASGVAVTFDDDTSVTPKVTVTSLPEDTELTFNPYRDRARRHQRYSPRHRHRHGDGDRLAPPPRTRRSNR